MKYNPNIHHRRSVRLRGYDYAKEGMYFITICTKNRVHVFGEVENGVMVLNHFGEIARDEWEKIPERWPHVQLGAFQIMPNHMHGVLLIGRPYSAITTVENRTDKSGVITIRATTRATPTDGTPSNSTQSDTSNDTASPNTSLEIPFTKIQWATRPYLGQIIGAYTSIVATACLKHHKQNQPDVWLDKIWQRSFDERIIRNAKMFDNVSNYIINNPKNWKEDMFFE